MNARAELSQIPIRVVSIPRPTERRPWGHIARWVHKRMKCFSLGIQSLFERRYIEGADASVPYNGCTACCRSGFHIDLEPWEPVEHLELEQRSDGVRRLRKNEDGSCVHLVNGRCTVYSRRPYTCRTYDCRDMAMAGAIHSSLSEGKSGGEHAPVDAVILSWGPECLSIEDSEVYVAMRFAMLPHIAHGELAKVAFGCALFEHEHILPDVRTAWPLIVAKATAGMESLSAEHSQPS